MYFAVKLFAFESKRLSPHVKVTATALDEATNVTLPRRQPIPVLSNAR